MLIQNTNPLTVAPDQTLVRRGFAREDLFTVVHEQVMTDTARMADIILPATMFVEHDDLYQAGGQQHILLGPKLIEQDVLLAARAWSSCSTNIVARRMISAVAVSPAHARR